MIVHIGELLEDTNLAGVVGFLSFLDVWSLIPYSCNVYTDSVVCSGKDIFSADKANKEKSQEINSENNLQGLN